MASPPPTPTAEDTPGMDGNTEDPVEVQPPSVADVNANESAEGAGMDDKGAGMTITTPKGVLQSLNPSRIRKLPQRMRRLLMKG